MEISVRCFVCEEIPKYTCPRCSIHYCSLGCYKNEKHQQCSEAFYKEQVIAELQDMKGSPTTKRKMLEMLQKQHIASSNPVENISSRLSDVHLDDADTLWERLSDHEKLMFQERVRKGNVDFLQFWQPWWESNRSSPKKLPSLQKDLPCTTSLTNGKQPSEKLKYNILEVLLAYTCVMRVFNGDLYDMPLESLELFFNLTNVLRYGYVYTDLETCLLHFIKNVEERRTELNMDQVQVCLRDLKNILMSDDSSRLVVRCMSDLYERLKKIKKILKIRSKKFVDSEFYNMLSRSVRKVYFFLVFSNEHERDVKDEVHILEDFCERLNEDKVQFEDQKKDIERHMNELKPKNSCLIEEL